MANATPAWRNNILACYPAILKRLEQVTQVKKVLEAQDFLQRKNAKLTEK